MFRSFFAALIALVCCITPAVASARTAATVAVTITSSDPPMRQLLGVDYTVQKDTLTNSSANQAIFVTDFKNAGITNIRYPDDRTDTYHCQSNSTATGRCEQNTTGSSPCNLAHDTTVNGGAHFDAVAATETGFMGFVLLVPGLNVNLGLNYGSNNSCSSGGSIPESLNFLNQCQTYTGQCTVVTVGTEVYHGCDPNSTYTTGPCVGGALNVNVRCGTSCPSTGKQYGNVFKNFYSSDARSGTKICYVSRAQQPSSGWDDDPSTGFIGTGATPDCQEIEFYPLTSGSTSDAALLASVTGGRTSKGSWQWELAQAEGFWTECLTSANILCGHTLPIYVDQASSVSHDPGHQTLGPVETVFAAMFFGESEQDPNVFRVTWHTGVGAGCNTPDTDGSEDYGKWIKYGDSSLFSIGDTTCNEPPAGTVFPMGATFETLSPYINGHGTVATTSVSGDSNLYAFSSNKYLLLVNLNSDTDDTVTVTPTANGSSLTGSGGTITTYDKQLFDLTKPANGGVWSGPATSRLSGWSTSFTVTVPAYGIVTIPLT